MSIGEVRRESQRPRDQMNRILVSSAVVCDHAEKVQCMIVVLRPFQHLAVERLSLVDPPCLMMFKAGLEISRNIGASPGALLAVAWCHYRSMISSASGRIIASFC